LHRVQDVTSEIRGFLHNILDYGFVHIQTAGQQQRFEFEEIAHPNEVAKEIMELVEEFRKTHITPQAEASLKAKPTNKK
ncbi:MAG: hypothetical protein ABH820_00955, partial [Patescibacteria group bacterium]